MENVNEECVLCGETVVIPANEVDEYSVLCDECHSANVSHGVVTENAVSVPKRSHTRFQTIFFPFFL